MAVMSFAVRWDIRISLLRMTTKMLTIIRKKWREQKQKASCCYFHICSLLTCWVSPVLVSNADTGCNRTRKSQRSVTKIFTSEFQALVKGKYKSFLLLKEQRVGCRSL